MQDKEFIELVRRRATLSSDTEAVQAIHATLETLAERVPQDDARDVAAQLPGGIKHYLERGHSGRPESFDVGELVRRVADRLGVDQHVAAARARAVLEVLREAVTPGALIDILRDLPGDIDQFILSRTLSGTAPAGRSPLGAPIASTQRLNATESAEDAARHYLDESAEFVSTWVNLWFGVAKAALRTQFDLQNSTVRVSRDLFDSTVQANRDWLDRAAGIVREGQDAGTKFVEASLGLLMPTQRGIKS
jgi:uncharacterized protein (DUF2267 family)